MFTMKNDGKPARKLKMKAIISKDSRLASCGSFHDWKFNTAYMSRRSVIPTLQFGVVRSSAGKRKA